MNTSTGSQPGRDRSPALALWRREVHGGRRRVTDLDPLWRAACLEIEAEEADGDRRFLLADKKRHLAAALIVTAAAQRAGMRKAPVPA